VGTATPASASSRTDPFKETFRLQGLNLRARYLEVGASNIRIIPAGRPAAGQKAWLFVDEVIVNPRSGD
jgi:hypothetical protein